MVWNSLFHARSHPNRSLSPATKSNSSRRVSRGSSISQMPKFVLTTKKLSSSSPSSFSGWNGAWTNSKEARENFFSSRQHSVCLEFQGNKNSNRFSFELALEHKNVGIGVIVSRSPDYCARACLCLMLHTLFLVACWHVPLLTFW